MRLRGDTKIQAGAGKLRLTSQFSRMAISPICKTLGTVNLGAINSIAKLEQVCALRASPLDALQQHARQQRQARDHKSASRESKQTKGCVPDTRKSQRPAPQSPTCRAAPAALGQLMPYEVAASSTAKRIITSLQRQSACSQ